MQLTVTPNPQGGVLVRSDEPVDGLIAVMMLEDAIRALKENHVRQMQANSVQLAAGPLPPHPAQRVSRN